MTNEEILNACKQHHLTQQETDFITQDFNPALALYVISEIIKNPNPNINFSAHTEPLDWNRLTSTEKHAIANWVAPKDYAATAMIREIFDALKAGTNIHSESFMQYLGDKYKKPIFAYLEVPFNKDTLRASVTRNINDVLTLNRILDKYNEVKFNTTLYRGHHHSIDKKVNQKVSLGSSFVSAAHEFSSAQDFQIQHRSNTILEFPKGSYTSARIMTLPNDKMHAMFDEAEVIIDPKKDAMYVVKGKRVHAGSIGGRPLKSVIYTLEEVPPSIRDRIKAHVVAKTLQPHKNAIGGMATVSLLALAGDFKHTLHKKGEKEAIKEVLNSLTFNLIGTLENQNQKYVHSEDSAYLQAIGTFNASATTIPLWMINIAEELVYVALHGDMALNQISNSIDKLAEGSWVPKEDLIKEVSCVDVHTCVPNIEEDFNTR